MTVVRIRTSCLQLFITSLWEYLKALIVHGPNHEVMITANKVLRALSSHCRVGTWGYSVLHSNGSIILPLQTHAVFWSSWLRTIVVPKQRTAAQLESQLHSGRQPQIPSVSSRWSVSGSGEETKHLICDLQKIILSPILLCLSHLLELHLLPPVCKWRQFWWCQQDSSKQATCHERAAPPWRPGPAPGVSAGCQPWKNIPVLEQGEGAVAAQWFIKSIRHQGAIPAKESKVNTMILRSINDTRSQRSPWRNGTVIFH